MKRSFNPNPILHIFRLLLLAVLVTALLFSMKDGLSDDIFTNTMIGIWLIVLIFTLLAFIIYKFRRISLKENSINYDEGILLSKHTVLPYSKITESNFTQTIFQRIFGVGTLRIDSAGGSAAAIFVHDVMKKDLEVILEEINAKTGKGS